MKNLSLIVLLAAAMPSAQSAPQDPPAPMTTIIVVRHAEAAPDSGTDPALRDAGMTRAHALAAALKDADVKAVMTTHYQRTILTGEPLAAAAKATLVKETIGGGAAGLDAYVRQIVQRVHAGYAGGTVVIVGHSNTVPALVKAFSGVDVGAIAHDAFDNLFIVTSNTPGSGRVVRVRYGT